MVDKEEKLLAYIKRYFEKKGYGPRAKDLEPIFIPNFWSSRQSLFNHLGKLVDRKILEKKSDPSTKDRYPRYYLSEEAKELGEKTVYKERIDTAKMLGTIPIKLKLNVNLPYPVFGFAGFAVEKGNPLIILETTNEKFNNQLLNLIKDDEEKRRELGDILLSILKFYVGFLSKEKPTFSVDYYKGPKKVFYVGNFPTEMSTTMKKAVDVGLFPNLTKLFEGLVNPLNPYWREKWEAFYEHGKTFEYVRNNKKMRFKYDKNLGKAEKVFEEQI